MANHKDAIKKDRQSKKTRASNRAYRSKLRGQIKVVRELIDGGNTEGAQTAFRAAQSLLHSLSHKGVIHSNNANRRIARLAAAIKAD